MVALIALLSQCGTKTKSQYLPVVSSMVTLKHSVIFIFYSSFFRYYELVLDISTSDMSDKACCFSFESEWSFG